jgi:hypothetical protein
MNVEWMDGWMNVEWMKECRMDEGMATLFREQKNMHSKSRTEEHQNEYWRVKSKDFFSWDHHTHVIKVYQSCDPLRSELKFYFFWGGTKTLTCRNPGKINLWKWMKTKNMLKS